MRRCLSEDNFAESDYPRHIVETYEPDDLPQEQSAASKVKQVMPRRPETVRRRGQ